MATYHVGAVMMDLDIRGNASGAWFSLYEDDSRPILRFAFADVERARTGAELVRELIEIVEKIGM